MPATPTPSGPLSKPLIQLAELVAESETFRVRSGLASNDADAAEKLIYGVGATKRIWLPGAGAPEKNFLSLLPLAVVNRAGFNARLKAGGAQNYLRPNGVLRLILSARPSYETDMQANLIDFENFCGGVVADIYGRAALDTRLTIDDVTEEYPAELCSETEETSAGGVWFNASFLFHWES